MAALLGSGFAHAAPLDAIRLVGDAVPSGFTVAGTDRLQLYADLTARGDSFRAYDGATAGILAPRDAARQNASVVATLPTVSVSNPGSAEPRPAASDDTSADFAWAGSPSIAEPSTCALIFAGLAMLLRAIQPRRPIPGGPVVTPS